MTIGISKERLDELQGEYSTPMEFNLISRMLSECTELNPWLPINENTPKDRPILLFYPSREPYDSIIKADYYSEFYGLCTKWQELPADPK